MENGRTPTNGVLETMGSGPPLREQNGTAAPSRDKEYRLQQYLSGPQIYFIVLSLVVGSGVFNNNGEVLRLAGPMGLFVAVLLFGTVAVCVGETVSELVQLFPVENAIFEYVDKFVDRDVSWAIGILYWYTYASIFPFQILNAADQLRFWVTNTSARIFASLIPFLLLVINLVDIKWFGYIETISGAIKLALVLVITIILYNVAGKGDIEEEYISKGFRNDPNYTSTPSHAFCYGLPLVAFSYIGVEAFSMAAFEAINKKATRVYSRLTHWTVIVLYFLCTLGIILTVDWNDIALPTTYDTAVPKKETLYCKTRSAVVLGVSRGLWKGPCKPGDVPLVAAVVNGILLFMTLSAANASLYIASRTLYGLTCRKKSWLRDVIGSVWPITHMPAMAVFLSFLPWYWLIYLDISRDKGNEATANFMHIINFSQSVSCIIVWAAICFAYIRFRVWVPSCKIHINDHPVLEYFIPDKSNYRSKTALSWLQPMVALYAFLACILILIFISASMWKTGVNGTKFMAAYLPHILFVLIVLIRKVYRHHNGLSRTESGYVDLSQDLVKELSKLNQLSSFSENDCRAQAFEMERI